jgi:integrase
MQISAVRALLRAGRRHGHRDELLFVLGINTAFRISDLLSLTIGDVWENGKPKGELRLKERKTAKPRACPLNNAVTTLVERYISELQPQNLGDPLFPSQKGGRLSRKRAFWILRDAGLKVGLKDIGTHSLRKTFGYHAYKKTGGNIALVQRLLNHDNPGDTLRYVGITKDEMDEVFISLNLGLDQGGQ